MEKKEVKVVLDDEKFNNLLNDQGFKDKLFQELKIVDTISREIMAGKADKERDGVLLDYLDRYPALKNVRSFDEIEKSRDVVGGHIKLAEDVTISMIQVLQKQFLDNGLLTVTENDSNKVMNSSDVQNYAKKEVKNLLYKVQSEILSKASFVDIVKPVLTPLVSKLRYDIFTHNKDVQNALTGMGTNHIPYTESPEYRNSLEKKDYVNAVKNLKAIQIKRGKGDGMGFGGGLADTVTRKEAEVIRNGINNYIYSLNRVNTVVFDDRVKNFLKESINNSNHKAFFDDYGDDFSKSAMQTRREKYENFDKQLKLLWQIQNGEIEGDKKKEIEKVLREIDLAFDNVKLDIKYNENGEFEFDSEKDFQFFDLNNKDDLVKIQERAANREDTEEMGESNDKAASEYSEIIRRAKRDEKNVYRAAGTIFDENGKPKNSINEWDYPLEIDGVTRAAKPTVVLNNPGMLAVKVNYLDAEKFVNEHGAKFNFDTKNSGKHAEVDGLEFNSLFDILGSWGVLPKAEGRVTLTFNEMSSDNKSLKKDHKTLRYPVHALTVLNMAIHEISKSIDNDNTISNDEKRNAKIKFLSDLMLEVQKSNIEKGDKKLFSFEVLGQSLHRIGLREEYGEKATVYDALAIQINQFGDNKMNITAKDLKNIDTQLKNVYLSEFQKKGEYRNIERIDIESQGLKSEYNRGKEEKNFIDQVVGQKSGGGGLISFK